MSRLHVYTVHINPSLPHPYEEAQFVEEGFSWKAFMFTAIWALCNRLWLFSFVILAVNLLILTIPLHAVNAAGILFIVLAWNMIIGHMGNDFVRKKLKKDGFITADIVTGDSLLRAEQRFFDRYFPYNNAAFVS